MPRHRTSELSNELGALLSKVVGDWSSQTPSKGSADPPFQARVGIALVEGHYEAWVQSEDRSERVALTCSADSEAVARQMQLLRKIVSVFEHDLAIVSDSLEAKEIWLELSETRFLRAAARLSNISTEHLVRRVRTFEAAARQTYEGSPFAGSVVMAHSLDTFRLHAGDRFRQFGETLTFERALLHEKWLKPFLEAGDFALVTTSYRGTARGFTDASLPWPTPVESAPVTRLQGLYGYLAPGTSVLSASPNGDVYFALPSGVTFVNSKGYWRYQDWAPLRAILAEYCSTDVAEQLLQLVRSASYEHQGSLFAILAEQTNPADVVADHQREGRSAQTLRSAVFGIDIVDPVAMKLLGVASQIDGAILVSREGRVLDVASMIMDPSPRALSLANQNELKRFPGARTTAAWNASIHGIAIKVSDDGPIDVYERGHLVFHAD